ncbi:hypothetical protein [Streptomyces sp. NPDC020951]|uniref:hypothetical protein n=1 Tax=Streptomyces sp. NPDC020951 TaxID=3365104 RepID=UPI003797DF08
MALRPDESFPAGFLVTGDAMCSFNPIYGQGMTVAALEATILGRLLKDGSEDVAAQFFTESAAVIDVPWTTVAANDLRFPDAVGDRSALDPERGAYLDRLRAAAVTSGADHRVSPGHPTDGHTSGPLQARNRRPRPGLIPTKASEEWAPYGRTLRKGFPCRFGMIWPHHQ